MCGSLSLHFLHPSFFTTFIFPPHLLLLPTLPISSTSYPSFLQFAVPTYVPKQAYDLLNRISGNGLSVTYTYTRRPHLSSSKMIGFELLFQNTSSSSISNIEINKSQLQSGMQMTDIPTIPQLGPGASISVSLGINFNDTLQPASFNIWYAVIGVFAWCVWVWV